MNFIASILTVLFCLFEFSAFAALNNENNPNIVCASLGSLTADGSVFMAASSKAMNVQSMHLLNGGAIAASNSDYALIQIRKGATVVAQIDTRAAGQGAIAANVPKAGVVVAAEKLIPAATAVTAVYDETDTGTVVALSSAVLCMTYAVK
jgi:hypothetical protein